jgi:hypothetical protein
MARGWSSDLLTLDDILAYQRDVLERTILFWDTLRQRADNMIAHERAGKPPLLDFHYEMILDARGFERTVNYALLRITRYNDKCLEDCLDPKKPPVIIVDPRAGHGPGIGGFKRESEVGIAMHEAIPFTLSCSFPSRRQARPWRMFCTHCAGSWKKLPSATTARRQCYTATARPAGRLRSWLPIVRVLRGRPFSTALRCPIGPESPTVYAGTEDLNQAGQRIVYLINPHVGHLGIFVSASVARLEHRAILDSLKKIEALAPGLYEMKIDNPTGDPDCRHDAYAVRFEERCVEDLRFPENRLAFRRVAEVSSGLDSLYSATLGKWIEATTTPLSARWMEWLHPMRASRYAFASDFNPWLRAWAPLAASIRQNRYAVPDTNSFKSREIESFDAVGDLITRARELRDQGYEFWFAAMYGVAPSGSAALQVHGGITTQCGNATAKRV